jgi:hypothetical protein
MRGSIRGGFCHILRIPDTPSLATDRRLDRSLKPSAWDMAAGVLKDNGRKGAGHRPSNRDLYRSYSYASSMTLSGPEIAHR